MLELKNLLNINKAKAQLFPYMLLMPAFVFILLFMAYPIINVFNLSLQNYHLIKPHEIGYIGFDNFKEIILYDSLFWSSLNVGVRWSVITVSLQFTLGLMLALLLNRKFKFRGMVRMFSFAPWAVAGVLAALIWGIMYAEYFGVLNDLLLKARLISQPIPWLAHKYYTFLAIVLAAVWRGIPFFAITILAVLQNIPEDLYESADIDGASSFKKFIYITFPMIKDTVILTTLLRLIWTFNYVDMIFALTRGGPVNATLTLPIYIVRKAIDFVDFGYASALSVLLFFIMIFFSALYIKMGNFGRKELF